MKQKNGAGFQRKADQRLIDCDFITPLFLKGQTFVQIALSLQEVRDYPVGYAMVRGDVVRIMKEWKKERANMIPAALELQLRKLERMEAVCWEQYERSKQSKTRTVQKEKSLFDKKAGKAMDDLTQRQGEKHVTENIGDGQWLDKIFRCWEMQSELLDLKGMGKPGGGGEVLPAVGELIFVTRSRKNNPQYDDAIEVTDDDIDITQKLLHS